MEKHTTKDKLYVGLQGIGDEADHFIEGPLFID